MRFEKAGIPAVLFATSSFMLLARTILKSLGMEGLRMVEVDHPLGGISEDGLAQRIEIAFKQFFVFAQSASR